MLNAFLLEGNDVACLISTGREFHSLGPLTAKQ